MTSVARRHADSGEYSDGSQDIEHSNSGNDGGPAESDYDSQGTDSDHSERDPDSQETERRVDDDEDRSNPQYIPKRGTFYEHDDRTAASGEEVTNTTSELSTEKKEGSEPATERRRPPRKSDIINKWSHDKFNENEQTPKSREELVAIYGYDIRNEDAPPHARRNRRYGRGPNKYTRTWEDEDAYRRQTAAQSLNKKPPNPDEFPDLDTAARRNSRRREVRPPRPRSKSQPASNESLNSSPGLRRNASTKSPKRAIKTGVKPTTPRPQPPKKDDIKMPALENLTITTSNNSEGSRRVSAVAQQRPVPTQHARNTPQNQQQNNVQNKPQQQVTSQQKPQTQQQSQQPATGAEPRGGSKRYSSLRQRPLAEPYAPQPPQTQPAATPAPPAPVQQQAPPPAQAQQQAQHRYHAAGNSGEFSTNHAGSPAHPHQQQHVIHQQQVRASPAPHASSPPRQAAQHAPQQQVRLGMLEQQQMVPHQHHAVHNMPQQHAIDAFPGQLQPTQGYAPPAMMPAQYMQSGSGAVYGGAAMYQQPQYSHPQMYPHHNYGGGGGGGVYYRCEEAPRTARRPTAAIPIVKPNNDNRPANSSEKDNIDRIVENMFVRKPWPAQGADSKDSKESRSSQEPKDQSQPNSLTSSTISNESKPSETRDEKSIEKEDPPPAPAAPTDD